MFSIFVFLIKNENSIKARYIHIMQYSSKTCLVCWGPLVQASLVVLGAAFTKHLMIIIRSVKISNVILYDFMNLILTPLKSLPICGNLTPGLGPPGGYLGPMNG